METESKKLSEPLNLSPDSTPSLQIGIPTEEELEFEESEFAAQQFEDKEEIRRQIQPTGFIDVSDWNDDHYPDYYLLGC